MCQRQIEIESWLSPESTASYVTGRRSRAAYDSKLYVVQLDGGEWLNGVWQVKGHGIELEKGDSEWCLCGRGGFENSLRAVQPKLQPSYVTPFILESIYSNDVKCSNDKATSPLSSPLQEIE